jgi:hypothetical protein
MALKNQAALQNSSDTMAIARAAYRHLKMMFSQSFLEMSL